MIYSSSGKYAIRACIHLAQLPQGHNALAKDVAQVEGVPAPFMAKILQQLARKGLLNSRTGPTGGFSLRMAASDITLMALLDAADGLSERMCFINGPDSWMEQDEWAAHPGWLELQARILGFLGQTTIADLVEAAAQRKSAMERPLSYKVAAQAAGGSTEPEGWGS